MYAPPFYFFEPVGRDFTESIYGHLWLLGIQKKRLGLTILERMHEDVKACKENHFVEKPPCLRLNMNFVQGNLEV